MKTSNKIALGTSIAGATAGLALGAKKASNLLSQYGMKGVKLDDYVNSRIVENAENVHKSLKKSHWADAFKKIADKAKTDFSKITKKATITKTKYAAGLTAVGVALGAVISHFVKNKSAKN